MSSVVLAGAATLLSRRVLVGPRPPEAHRSKPRDSLSLLSRRGRVGRFGGSSRPGVPGPPGPPETCGPVRATIRNTARAGSCLTESPIAPTLAQATGLEAHGLRSLRQLGGSCAAGSRVVGLPLVPAARWLGRSAPSLTPPPPPQSPASAESIHRTRRAMVVQFPFTDHTHKTPHKTPEAGLSPHLLAPAQARKTALLGVVPSFPRNCPGILSP